jgi:hypothetical protein
MCAQADDRPSAWPLHVDVMDAAPAGGTEGAVQFLLSRRLLSATVERVASLQLGGCASDSDGEGGEAARPGRGAALASDSMFEDAAELIQAPDSMPSPSVTVSSILRTTDDYPDWEAGKGPNGGEGITLDVAAKRRAINIEALRLYCKEGIDRTYEVYYRLGCSPDPALCNSPEGWILVHQEREVPERTVRTFRLTTPIQVGQPLGGGPGLWGLLRCEQSRLIISRCTCTSR